MATPHNYSIGAHLIFCAAVLCARLETYQVFLRFFHFIVPQNLCAIARAKLCGVAQEIVCLFILHIFDRNDQTNAGLLFALPNTKLASNTVIMCCIEAMLLFVFIESRPQRLPDFYRVSVLHSAQPWMRMFRTPTQKEGANARAFFWLSVRPVSARSIG